MEAEIVLTHPVLGDTRMGEAQVLSIMDREIQGESNGGWKYKDKGLQAAHEVEVAKASYLRSAPPVKLSKNADQLSGNTGNSKKSEKETNNTEGGGPSE